MDVRTWLIYVMVLLSQLEEEQVEQIVVAIVWIPYSSRLSENLEWCRISKARRSEELPQLYLQPNRTGTRKV